MEYFKYELWSKINSQNKKERLSAEIEWSKNDKAYYEIFQEIKNRLPHEFITVYMKNKGFHDFYMKSIEILSKDSNYILRHPNDIVEVGIVLTDEETTCKLIYTGIQKVLLDYKDIDISDISNQKGFDIFGYDEFLSVDEETLSHEILFCSGSSILIYFNQVSIINVDEMV